MNKFSVENLRSFLSIKTDQAKEILEIAVSTGVLKKGIQLYCPEGGVLYSTDEPDFLPKTLECHHLEEGDYELHWHGPNSLTKQDFYFVEEK